MSTKLEDKVRELEGLVLANRYGARTIWGGFMITVIGSIVFIVLLMFTIMVGFVAIEQGDDGSVSLASGGGAAVIFGIFIVIAYYVAMVVGTVKIILGFYRMARPEKYAARMLEEKSEK